MATGLCIAAAAITAAEIERLDNLPDAANETVDADGCQFKAGHTGRHAWLAQVQDGGENTTGWWVMWDAPAGTDPSTYEIVSAPFCEEPDPDGIWTCEHPAAHEGPHRFD
ncbi:hypothetical protein [Actinacidiphila acididurans]|uniref:Uncharacterized protein n=1 Tax=Actinacidiphila acididurans TaxID=2784346 RepID=A0ABS2TXA1_9ACTN|nr:hypothetical protein [Actinacidiphila acididurans]MBM9507974.1 hypothetical protein [Actinacidiphila acididurans]